MIVILVGLLRLAGLHLNETMFGAFRRRCHNIGRISVTLLAGGENHDPGNAHSRRWRAGGVALNIEKETL
jgi:hypothetical protein